MSFKDVLETIRATSTQQKFYGKIRDDHVLLPGFEPRIIIPNERYFQIRLAEMFLRDQREYWRSFVPLGIIMSDFLYKDARSNFPFFVGNGLLKEIQQYVEDEQVEYRNSRVAGPIPYIGDDVGLFVGLFRVQVTNIAANLFGVIDKVVSTLDATQQLSNYLKIASALGEGLSDVLGMKEVERRFAIRDVFSNAEGSSNPFREGYLAYINCDEKDVSTKELWVKDDRLFIGSSTASAKPFRQSDYCLIHLHGYDRRDDYTALPFDKTWRDARAKIFQHDQATATRLLMDCCQQIADSPDLTQKHAYNLQRVYITNFQQAAAQFKKLHGFTSQYAGKVSRGEDDDLTPQAKIQKTVAIARQAGTSNDVLTGLLDISKHWDQIPHLKDCTADLELTDAVLNEQLQAIESFNEISNPNPKALAKAITVATLSGG